VTYARGRASRKTKARRLSTPGFRFSNVERAIHLQNPFFTAAVNSVICGIVVRICAAVFLSTAPPAGMAVWVMARRSSTCFASAHAVAFSSFFVVFVSV